MGKKCTRVSNAVQKGFTRRISKYIIQAVFKNSLNTIKMIPHSIKIENILDNIVDALNAGFTLLDKNMNVIWANEQLSLMLNLKYNPVGRTCREVYSCECQDIEHCFAFQAFSSGKKQYSETQLITEKGERRYIHNITIPVKGDDNRITYLVKLSTDITVKEEKIHQLLLLRKLVELMQGTSQIESLLHLILTCVTAGTALGFNRARLFLVDKTKNIVYGKMAVGPSSWEEANKIWGELANKYEKLEDLIRVSSDKYRDDTSLHMNTRLMAYSLLDEKEIIVSCIKQKKPILERNAFHNPDINKNFVNMIGAGEFVCVPFVAKDEVLGVICADNYYNSKPITEEHVQLLSTFANHAALAIENAEAYKKIAEKIHQLKETQERLIRSERLAVIGNMATYIAHEIRNPLVTIGGFARTIVRAALQDKQIAKSADIIVEEVNRLERILANIMDFSKPVESVKTEIQVNEILENTCSLMEPYFKNSRIHLVKKFDSMIPKITIDQAQIKQVFLNLIKNAVESMPGGGKLTLETHGENKFVKINITDTGEGMTTEIMQNIFVPFFTTKVDGTGVGLAVSQKIVDDHGGSIKVKSTLQGGTTFSIYLPMKRGE